MHFYNVLLFIVVCWTIVYLLLQYLLIQLLLKLILVFLCWWIMCLYWCILIRSNVACSADVFILQCFDAVGWAACINFLLQNPLLDNLGNRLTPVFGSHVCVRARMRVWLITTSAASTRIGLHWTASNATNCHWSLLDSSTVSSTKQPASVV